jgi:hypothetical protein
VVALKDYRQTIRKEEENHEKWFYQNHVEGTLWDSVSMSRQSKHFYLKNRIFIIVQTMDLIGVSFLVVNEFGEEFNLKSLESLLLQNRSLLIITQKGKLHDLGIN